MALLGQCALAAALALTSALAQPHITPPKRIEMAPSKFPVTDGKPTIDRPSFAGRVVSMFDFEEQAFNPDEVPRNWYRAQDMPPERERAGFPPWNQAAFDHTTSVSGTTSVKLPTAGGSASLRLAGGLVQVFPDAEYRVSAKVRTEGLQHARAVLEVALLDENQRPIPGGVVRTRPITSPDKWTDIALTLRGPLKNTRSLRVDLLLLQPDQLGGERPIDKFAPRQQDYNGAAWFDDIVILQLPRVRLTTTSPANMFVAPATPEITARVQDLTGEELKAEIVVTDIDENVVDTQRVILARGGSELRVTPKLKKFGWYRVQMNLVEVDGLGATAGGLAATTLLYLGPPPSLALGEQGTRGIKPFGIACDDLPGPCFPALAQAIDITGVSRVTAPVPLTRHTSSIDNAASLSTLLDHGYAQPVEFTFALTSLPGALADQMRVDPNAPMNLGLLDPNEWTSPLRDVLSIYGTRITSWQIGALNQPVSVADDRLGLAMNNFRKGLHRISPNPRLVLPWRADEQWLAASSSPRAFGGVSLFYPASYPNESIPVVVANAQPIIDEGADLTFILEHLDPREVGRRAQLNDFYQRAALLWGATQTTGTAQSRPKIAAYNPWRTDPTAPDRVLPRPTLAALTVLGRHTEGRRVVGDLPVGERLRAMILAPDDGSAAIGSLNIGSGALLVWCDDTDDAQSSFTGYFGGGTLTLIDAFGNRTTLPPDNASGRHTIPVTATPTFVEGIDAHLVKFLADIKINPQLVPAIVTTHDCELILKNPWNNRITGDIQVSAPDTSGRRDREWSFAPSAPIPFSIGPGGQAKLPFSFIFSAAEEAGVKNLNLLVRLSADRQYPSMRVGKTISVGLEDLDLQVAATVGPREDGPNVIVTATVTNSGKLSRTLQLSSHAPGFATQSQPIVDLGPSESAVRRFVLPNGAEALAGRRVRVQMVDVDGAERLTKFATVPQ